MNTTPFFASRDTSAFEMILPRGELMVIHSPLVT
jgi:hypothetical protein